MSDEASVTVRPQLKLKADFKAAENLAYRLLKEHGLDRPPIDPVWLANELGVKVTFVEFDEASRSVSGFYDPEDMAIYVNKDEVPARQTFTIAHELGHHLLHHEWAASNNYKVLMRDADAAPDPYEREANAFAAHLLVPTHMLKAYSPIASDVELSRLFMVSLPMLRFRKERENIRGD